MIAVPAVAADTAAWMVLNGWSFEPSPPGAADAETQIYRVGVALPNGVESTFDADSVEPVAVVIAMSPGGRSPHPEAVIRDATFRCFNCYGFRFTNHE
jgi:hypothetical protein